uniref:Nesprin-1 spectrin repeats region domain-containing protein n=1 Tax=Timema monikensis TaxID=170555 RepID=A0A7R9E8R9_9NEOP|nr:unnamed protein product [Timema monikensis]
MSDDSSDLVQISGETRISVNVQQITSRFQSIQTTAKEIVKKCEQAVTDHEAYLEKYKQCSAWLAAAQARFERCRDGSSVGERQDLVQRSAGLRELLAEQPSATSLLNATVELGEKLYPSTAMEGREDVRQQLQELQQAMETLYDGVSSTERELQAKLSRWTGFEECSESLRRWLTEVETQLPQELELKTTLDEKRAQLQTYRALLHDAVAHQQDIVSLRDKTESLPERNTKIDEQLDTLTRRHDVILKRDTGRGHFLTLPPSTRSSCSNFVERYEGIVSDHQHYSKAVMDTQEWLEATHNTVLLWGDTQLERISLHTNLERLKNMQLSSPEEESRIQQIRSLGEKVIPGTVDSGQINIRSQIDSSQQEWEGLLSAITLEPRSSPHRRSSDADISSSLSSFPVHRSTIEALDSKLQQWNEYESLKDQCMSWIRETDTKLHAVDLQATAQEKKQQLEILKALQGEVRAKELEIDAVTGTVDSGQINIRSQIDSSQQEWEGLLSAITLEPRSSPHRRSSDADISSSLSSFPVHRSTIEALDSKLQQWNEYESLKDQCMSWIRETDTKLHAVDLQATAQEKKQQLEILKALQGEVRAKELEIDAVTERAQQLHKGAMSSRSSQISELGLKYQQVSHKVKELTSRWLQYVTGHQEFDSHIAECMQWLEDIRNKIAYCSDLSAPSQKDLESKLETIQDLLLYKEEGFTKVQGTVELAQAVLANTAPSGHDAINQILGRLQEEWSALASKMVETKAILDDSIHRWAGFLEQIHQLNKTVDYLESVSNEISDFQTTMSEKRAQLERIKCLDEKVRCEKIEVDSLKAKAAEMLASGQQSHAASQAQEILNKFDMLAERIKNLLSERDDQFKDHRLYKEAYDDLTGWLSRSRDKVPSMKQRPLSDKLAIESAVVPLEALLNKQAQGELLVDHLTHTGEVVIASTSPQGQEVIRKEIRALKENFEGLFKEIKQQKEQLEATVVQWRDYKEEYERISDWLQQLDILVKAQKTALLATLPEKIKQVQDVKDILERLEKGREQIDKFNSSASGLLSSHLDTYINNQLRHLSSRYQVQVNLGKDVLKKVETNAEQHQQYEDNLGKAKAWIDNAKQVIRDCSEASSNSSREVLEARLGQIQVHRSTPHPSPTSPQNSSREVLEARLGQIQDLLRKREVGQNLVHTTVNCGEKVLRNTRSDGKDMINAQLREVQSDWDRLVKKISTAKVHLETSLLQWADYSSSYSQLQQWITDREAKLQQACEQKVTKAKKGQAPGMSSFSIGERKATLRQTNSIVQDIVSFEPMIQSVASKAEDLLQAKPASEISSKYETLSKQARDLYAKQKETVEQHQAFIDAGNDFVQWIRAAKEKLSKCSEPTGDKESLSSKVSQLKVLESEQEEGQKKLEKALEQGDAACQVADPEDKEVIEEEVALLQEEYDTYVESLSRTKTLLEVGIVKWTEYEDQYQEASDWLTQTEQVVQSFNKLQDGLEEKKNVLEQFQVHLQTLFDWQKELDRLNMKAQMLLETCADTRISNAVTHMTTKYNALLSLAKEIMRRLELHYQSWSRYIFSDSYFSTVLRYRSGVSPLEEHQQHNTLYQECQDWVDRTRDKLNECHDIPDTLPEVNNKLQTVKTIRQSLEQGQNKLRYALELKEKVILNTEQNGAAKIQEDTENLKQEFEKLMTDVHELRQRLTHRATQLEELQKAHKALSDWLEEIEHKVQSDDSAEFLNDLSEKRATLEKFRSLQRDIISHNEMVERLRSKLSDDQTIPPTIYQPSLDKYKHLKYILTKSISTLEEQVKEHESYKQAYLDAFDWVRKTRIEIQQCNDPHGEKEQTVDKEKRVTSIANSLPEGEKLVDHAVELSNSVMATTGEEGQDSLRQEIQQLKADWEGLAVMCKDTQKVLDKCITSWSEFADTFGRIKSWLQGFQGKVDAELEGDKKTPEDLNKCRALLQEAVQQKVLMEELSDRCESLMELSACSWVRDQTVQLQGTYTNLLTTVQGLVSRVEKNLSDHTEFLKAKDQFDLWLKRAHGTVKDCIGVGDEAATKDRLETIRLVSTRMTEGQHLMSTMQEVFTKAINTTPTEQQESLREDMVYLRDSWDQLTMDLNSVTSQLKAAMNRWEDYNDSKSRLQLWISDMEESLKESPDTKAELGEMKTLIERYKHIQDEIQAKRTDLDHLLSEAAELSVWASRPEVLEEAQKLQTRWDQLSSGYASIKHNLELEIQEYTSYHQSLQDTEKWLLQISFQLMAHNSLYITNKEQTQDQISQHEALLGDIQRYQSTLDDLKAKGHGQVERYVSTTPSIKVTIDKQLRNVQDSYDSLLHTALQIKNRLMESLAKFQEYEDTLESILRNLDVYEPLIAHEIETPVGNLETAQNQLETARSLHNKLQSEKSRLAVAVQACEAAAACISRPSSPQDTMPPPIPDKELLVRARLEDLIDQRDNRQLGEEQQGEKLRLLLKHLESQSFLTRLNALCDKVQGRLSALSSTVSELEELQKQREVLHQWVSEQRATVADWRSKPSKLRPEAARAELAAMNEMMGGIGDRRVRLLTELTAQEGDQEDLEGQIEQLETELTQVMSKKQGAQGVIEDYRSKVQETHGWLDSLVKRMEVLDKGSGLDCGQKLAIIVELSSEFEDQGPGRVEEVKRLAAEVVDLVSNLDSQQVEEQLRSVERRYNDIAKRVQRKVQVLEMAQKGLDAARQEIQQARDWVKDKKGLLESQAPLGYESKAADDRLLWVKSLLKEVEGKEVLLETLERRANTMSTDLEPSEHQHLESALRNLNSEHTELLVRLKGEVTKVSLAGDARRELEGDVEAARAWLRGKKQDVVKLGGYLPLRAEEVDKEIHKYKKFEMDSKDFGDGKLSDLQKHGNSLLKECSDPDKKRLQALLQDVGDEYEVLSKEIQEKLSSLADLLQGRKQFEEEVNHCQHWLNEAEVATSAEIRAPNVGLLEEQLSKYDKLNQEADQMRSDLERIIDQGKAILPTVSEADKLTLSEQLNAIKDRHARIAGLIRDRSNGLKDQLSQCKVAAAKVAESVQFMTGIQAELKELSKPVGSKVEDVRGMLEQYEKILSDLKANKSKLGDLQLGSMGDLQGISQQQDDLILSIESQIARLRQLLLLREQFIALITEIMTFITKYTEVVRDIERGGHTVQEKIKKYDDVIVKIQECDALLSSATDKGQTIAAEGSASDRNSITEQLQSLKQSLQALRRAVEKQREQHEMTAAEHRKLGAELEVALDWLHAHEAAVRSRPLLDRDPASVEKELDNHKLLAAEVTGYLDRVKAVQDAARHEDGMPTSLLEQLSEANSLLNSLPRELEERGRYLEANRQLRLDYAALKDRLHAWVVEAQERLQKGAAGVDFQNVVADLEEHKMFFSTEPAMKELVSQQIQQAADHIWPSLTGVEQEELSREQQQLTQLLKNTLNSAKSRRAQLEQDTEMWRDYRDTLAKVRGVLARSEFNDEPVTSLAGLHFNIQKLTHGLNDIQEFETKWQAFESLVVGNEEKSRHIDLVVRSKSQIIEMKQTIQDLLNEVEGHKSLHEEVLFLSGTVLTYLTAFSEPSAQILKAKLDHLTDTYKK